MSKKIILLGRFLPGVNFMILDSREPYVVGRATSCSVKLDDVTVSRQHAQLVVSGLTVKVTDLASRNGTFVNDVKIATAVVMPGQRIRFGDVSVLMDTCADSHPAGTSDLMTEACQGPGGAPGAPLELAAKLTPARLRVYRLLCEGLLERDIAFRLSISPNTVHHHVNAILRIFGVHSQKELLVLARSIPLSGTSEIS